MINEKLHEIRLGGLSSVPSSYQSKDGDLQICHNLVHNGEGLKPLLMPRQMTMISDDFRTVDGKEKNETYNGIVFVHKTSSDNIYICVTKSNNAYYYIGNTWYLIDKPATGLFSEGNYQITNVKNMLVVSVLSSEHKGMYYYRWKVDDGDYKYAGHRPPDAQLEFFPVYYNKTKLGDGYIDFADVPMMYNSPTKYEIKFTDDGGGVYESKKSMHEGYNTWVTDIQGGINRVISEYHKAGMFFNRLFVRYAYKLYDGTYYMVSSPIYISPQQENNPMVFPYNLNKGSENGKDTVTVHNRLVYKPYFMCCNCNMTESEREQLKDWEDIIQSVCIFVTPEIIDYKQDPEYIRLIDKKKIIANPDSEEESDGADWKLGAYNSPCDYDYKNKYYPVCFNNYSNADTGANYIASASSPLDINKDTTLLYGGHQYTNIFSDDDFVDRVKRNILLLEFEHKQQNDVELIEEAYNFFLLEEIQIKDIGRIGTDLNTEIQYPSVDIKFKHSYINTGDTIEAPVGMSFIGVKRNAFSEEHLITQEKLTDIDTSNLDIYPQILHVYNGRLNAANVELRYNTFPHAWLGGQQDGYNSKEHFDAFVEIQKNGETTYAYIGSNNTSYSLFNQNAGYLFYPDTGAKNIYIRYKEGESEETSYTVYTIPLSLHPHLNGTYFYDPTFSWSKYRKYKQLSKLNVEGIRQDNMIYVSDVNNPFVFPLMEVESIGSGSILSIKSATKATSEGTAFGTFPLYAFCTDGIYALKVNSNGSYAAPQALSREVIVGRNSALQLDDAVAFITKKGVMLLQGGQVVELSAVLGERFNDFYCAYLDEWDAIRNSFAKELQLGEIGYLESDDFLTSITRTEVRMTYDYLHKRIYIYRPNNQYGFVYNIPTKTWSSYDNYIVSSVEDFPDTIINYKRYDSDEQDVVSGYFTNNYRVTVGVGIYLTRPLKLGAPDVMKTVYLLRERSNINGAQLVSLWGSNDLEHFNLIGGKMGTVIPRLSGHPYRYIIACGMSEIQAENTISRITLTAKEKYINKVR